MGNTVLSMHFDSFNNECVTIKEEKDIYLLSQETQLKRVNCTAELVSFEIAYTCFIKAVSSIPSINFTVMVFLGQTKGLSDFCMQWS